MDATYQWPEKTVDDAIGKAGLAKGVDGGDVVAGQQLSRRYASQPRPQAGHPQLVGQRPYRRQRGRHGSRRPAERVGNLHPFAVAPDECARVKGLQAQGGDVELPVQFGVGGEGDLETSVEEIPVDVVGANPAADVVAGFEHQHRQTGLVKGHRTRQAGETGADDNNGCVWTGVGSEVIVGHVDGYLGLGKRRRGVTGG